MEIEEIIFLVIFLFILTVAFVIRVWVKRAREQRNLLRYNSIRKSGLNIPDTLHPVFDSSRCIGSGTCTHVCPEGDHVVGCIQDRGVLVDPSKCIGHGRCAAQCPMGAIRLVFGTSERGVDIPHVTSAFETNIKGLYITGELGGMGLIANAVRQATEGVDNIARALKKNTVKSKSVEPLNRDVLDLIIVGAGPAGLASAFAARSHGLSFRIFDKEADFGGSIRLYPRNKIVMTSPMNIPLMGKINVKTMSKEELVILLKKGVDTHNIKIETGVLIDDISKNSDNYFTVKINDGEVIAAKKIMLCVGRRGVPRKPGVNGERKEHVFYSMTEPEVFKKKKVLVVGGGDSAVETACMLAKDGVDVSLSYRSSALSRVKTANREKFEKLVEQNRLNAIFNSNLVEIFDDSVLLKIDDNVSAEGTREIKLDVDNVIVQIGGVLPTALLKKIGVSIERNFGEESEVHKTVESDDELYHRIRLQRRSAGLKNYHNKSEGIGFGAKLFYIFTGFLIMCSLFYFGSDYYLAPENIRRGIADLRFFSAAGHFGHGMGVWASIMMLVNLTYFIRKEFRLFSGAGNIKTWMFFHQLSGILAGLTVLLHTGLIMYNYFAMALYLSMGIVVATGIVGRYLFVMVPLDPRGRPLTHLALIDLSDRMKQQYSDLFGELDLAIKVNKILDMNYSINLSLPKMFVRIFTIWAYRYLKLLLIFRNGKKEVKSKFEFENFKKYSIEMARLHLQMEISPSVKRVLSYWRSGHALLALMTITLVIVHIFVEIWVGY